MIETELILNKRYRLIQKLGHNAGQQTWKAEDVLITSTKFVIVKLLAFDPQSHWKNLKLFEREASVLKHIYHPSIPRYRDYFAIEDHQLWFGLVHDYIPGASLKTLVTQGRKFSETEVCNIASSVLNILIYLHELSPSVLHRDIKPSNIILGKDDQIYLIDFGAAQARAAAEGETFTIVGTYGYTPMEQYGGRAIAASDLYALGATLIHLLTGNSPADLPHQNARIQFHQHVSISTKLTSWIDKLTDPIPDQRFQTARQAISALKTPSPSSFHALTVSKPHSSRIQLLKSPSQLKIKIPSRRLRVGDSLMLLGLLGFCLITIPFGLITFPYVVLYWLIGLGPLSFLILSTFSNIELCFNQAYFVLRWRVLGLCYRKQQGATTAICEILESVNPLTKANGEPLTSIKIQTNQRSYRVSSPLSSFSLAESQWIMREIRTWLNLSS